MTETLSIDVQRIERKLYEAETAGLIASFLLIDGWESEVDPADGVTRVAYDVKSTTGDGEKSYDTLVVAEGADMVAEIRVFMTEKLKETESRTEAYLVVERDEQRKRAIRNLPLIKSVFKDSGFIVTARDLVVTFTKDTTAPRTKDGHPYVLYSYMDATGKFAGEVEVVGDHAPLYEFLPLIEAELRIRAVRQQLVQEKTETK